MIIKFKTSKLEKIFNSGKALIKEYGSNQAKCIQDRMFDLDAAESLADLRALQYLDCHELKGNRKGQLAIDLKHPFRLVFKPDHDPVPSKPDGGLDWAKVELITILEVVDYHGR